MDELINAIEEAIKAAAKGRGLPKVTDDTITVNVTWGRGKAATTVPLRMDATVTVLDMPRYAKNIWHAYEVATR